MPKNLNSSFQMFVLIGPLDHVIWLSN